MCRYGVLWSIATTLVMGWPALARADVGVRVAPGELGTAWSFDPLVLFSLTLAGWLYSRGLAQLRARTGAVRTVGPVHAACYYASLGLIALALLSPLDALSQELSAAHMVQHMLLIVVAAPLFVLGSPALIFAYAMPPLWRQLLGLQWLAHKATWHPLVVWCLFAATLWGWHHPLLYQAALRDPLVHDAQHLSFFVAAFLFWRIVLDPLSRRRLHAPVATPYLFATSLHASALGIFLTLATAPWYADYLERTAAFGFTPLADQQLAGLIMWVPACLIYPLIAMALLVRWLADSLEDATSSREGCLS